MNIDSIEMSYLVILFRWYWLNRLQRCPWQRQFFKNSSRQRCGSGRFFKNSSRQRSGGGRIFLRTLKKCMKLIEFQCLQVKQPETEWIWWSSTNISGPIQSWQWNLEHFFKKHRGSGNFSAAMDISDRLWWIGNKWLWREWISMSSRNE